MKTLLAISLLALAPVAHAQSGGERARPSKSDESAARPSVSAPMQFLLWATGDKAQPGAYDPPALCCRLAHDLSNAYVGPKQGAFRGLNFSLAFVRDILSNPKVCAAGPAVAPGRHGRVELTLCAAGETLGLPKAEVLAVPPQPVMDWLKPTSAAGAMFRYFSAAEDEKKPHQTLAGAREEFFEVAFAEALNDEAARKALCADIEPQNAACPGELATSTPEVLHARIRVARAR